MIEISIPRPVLSVDVMEELGEHTSWESHFLVTIRLFGSQIVWQSWDTDADNDEDALERASEYLADRFRRLLE